MYLLRMRRHYRQESRGKWFRAFKTNRSL